MKRSVGSSGFTIVELLIVIVVIGILATITLMAYNGVQNSAREAQMKSDLKSAHQALLVDKELNNQFPATLADAHEGKGLKASGQSTYEYTVDNEANPPTFYLSVKQGNLSFYTDQTGEIMSGVAPGHHSGSGVPPSTVGYYDFSSSTTASTMTINPGTTIANGSWMVVVVAYTDTVYPTLPAGWTTLINRITTGTLRTSVFGKIKTSSDTFPVTVTMGSGGDAANGVIMWGAGAAGVDEWILGDHFWRDNTTATQYITVAPSLTTTSAQNLILAISTERTNASESDVSSVTNATKWFFIPQVGTSRIQTITVSTAQKANPGATTVVTVTYPNLQVLNGMSFQLALPPAS